MARTFLLKIIWFLIRYVNRLTYDELYVETIPFWSQNRELKAILNF